MAQTQTRFFPDGDYPALLNQAFAAYEAAQKDEQSNGEGMLLAHEQTTSEILRQEYEDLRAQARADAESKNRVVEMRAISRREWRPLKKAHPPRLEGDDVSADVARGDRLAGVNTDSIEDDLVHATIVKPHFETREAFDAWADDLSEGEWKTLVRDAWKLANVAQVDPKALPPSPTRSNGEN
ncbi:hypothetical protein [Nocardioides sp. SYSU D00065]|uniref:hypothetical protein n=1 Tax=Nocardioides sp. SYSU D00065 TaxID=2817378 RepID=UPI001B344455|nr:hypothetical protein [Nocardioides sp. SYSU D00065]